MLNKLTPHVYWLAANSDTDRPILGAVSGSKATLVVDGGNSPAHARLFLAELAPLHLAEPRYLALTHWHWDHIFGAHTFGLPTFSTMATRREIAWQAGLDWSDAALDQRVLDGQEIEFCQVNIKKELPDRRGLLIKIPDIGFNSNLEIDLGGITCQLAHVGGDHSADSSVVYVAEERVLFLGDCLYSNLYAPQPTYTTAKLFPLLDRLLSYQADYYLEAHAPQPTPRRQMVQFAETLTLIGSEVDRIGPDRPALLTVLPDVLDGPLSAEHLEYLDAFLAGLEK